MKRTTLIIDDELYASLKARAAEEGRTLTEIVERTLRLGLGAERQAQRPRLALPSYDLGPFLVDPQSGPGAAVPGAPMEPRR